MTPNFQLPSTPYVYRPLKRGLSGWDVYALQTALKAQGHNLDLDGVFGLATQASVTLWQSGRGLEKDGIAGILTQRDLALAVGEKARDDNRLPIKLLMGQIESESGFQVGNHTSVYIADHSRDLGVVQRNDRQQGITWGDGFSVLLSLEAIGRTIRRRHDNYLNAPLRTGFQRASNKRAWRLAAGSWNRPAHTAYLAGMRTSDPITPASETLTAGQHEWIEGYIDRVCTYADDYYALRLWPL